jgi:large subunit ribosomal protein L18
MAVSRSNKNIGAQLIDDVAGRTLCAISSLSKDLRAQCGYGGNKKSAALVGKALGEKARSMGIEQVCFDRRGFRFHGRIKALADAAREAGLKF